MTHVSNEITLEDVVADDFEELLAFRIAAMRESLERIGRFDPVRARERLRASFEPANTRFIVWNGTRIGFYALRIDPDAARLDHFYIHPQYQSQGIGGRVLRFLLAATDAQGIAVRLGALRDSDSQRFYMRHGFQKFDEDEWDVYFERRPESA